MSGYVDWGLDAEPPTLATREADYLSECGACDEQIFPGDSITLEDGEWIHESCADS
jgi:hypothetical protein